MADLEENRDTGRNVEPLRPNPPDPTCPLLENQGPRSALPIRRNTSRSTVVRDPGSILTKWRTMALARKSATRPADVTLIDRLPHPAFDQLGQVLHDEAFGTIVI